jgi:predicted DNA-binding transcriptional regulator AlpA
MSNNAAVDEGRPLSPNEIVRLHDGARWFGVKRTQLQEKIKSGEIPKPAKLSRTGRATGWTGAQIIAHQRAIFGKKGAA